MARKTTSLLGLAQQHDIDRFWSKVEKTETCWLWRGSTPPSGRGIFRLGRTSGALGTGVYRFSYELAKGPIPDGFVVDHLCKNALCVNPDHLDAVTEAENLLRGDGLWGRAERSGRCSNGHDLTAENLYTSPGARVVRCRTCLRDARAARYVRDSEALGRAPRAPRGFCTHEGCDRHHYAKGLCQKHYSRMRYARAT